MKKTSFLFLPVLVGLCLLSCNQNPEKERTQSSPQTTNNTSNTVEGGWQLVWAEYDGKLADTSNYYLFKEFNNGVFSLIAYDSTKKINFAGYGKYEFEGDTYHETFMYHNTPQYVGAANWEDLVVRGDTMYMNGSKKIVVGGQDVTAGWRKAKEKLVRVKW